MTESESGQGIAHPRILVGVDGSEDGLRAVRYATREALAGVADVWIVHAVDEAAPITGLWDLVSSREVLLRAGEAIIAEASGVVAELGLPAERVAAEVVVGRPSDVLTELSGKARLLVVGRRSLSGLENVRRFHECHCSGPCAVPGDCDLRGVDSAPDRWFADGGGCGQHLAVA